LRLRADQRAVTRQGAGQATFARLPWRGGWVGDMREETMEVQEVIAQARDTLTVKRVFGEPYEQHGVTVIPAARVRGGAGGGGGEDATGKGKGSGSGFGMTAHPVGAFMLRDGELRWRPAGRRQPDHPRRPGRRGRGPADGAGHREGSGQGQGIAQRYQHVQAPGCTVVLPATRWRPTRPWPASVRNGCYRSRRKVTVPVPSPSSTSVACPRTFW